MDIYDIAEKSGYSIATVSRVINSKGAVSKKAREKILSVIEESGYTPNVFARGLGLNSIKMVGVLCSDVADIYYATAVSVIENELREKGYDVILSCTGNNIANKKKSMELLLAKKVDALILVGSVFKEKTDNSHIEKAAKSVPVVIINGYVEAENVYSVMCNDRGAVMNTVSLLQSQGIKDIIYVYESDTVSTSEKLTGFRQEMQKVIENPPAYKCDATGKATDALIASFLENGRKPEAIMTSNDLLAACILRSLYEYKIRVPQDIRLIGYDNSIISQHCIPAISSIDSKVRLLSAMAVRTLIDIFDGKDVSVKTMVEANVIMRET